MKDIHIKAYSDLFIKYLFCTPGNEDILISFINAVFENSKSNQISTVEIKNPFSIDSIQIEKQIIVDIRAKDELGRIYNIEVQSVKDHYFKQRALYYWAKLYTSELTKGISYSKLKPVISINILNFIMLPEIRDIHNWFYLAKNDNPNIRLNDHLFIHFLELPKLKKKIPKTIAKLEKWLYIMLYEGNKDINMNEIIQNDKALSKVHEHYEAFTKDPKAREIYEQMIEAERREKTLLESAREEGIQKGREEDIIKLYQKLGLTTKKIADIFEIDEIIIKEILKNNNIQN